jgi:hypothetical protein
MSLVTAKALIDAQYANTSATTQYTAPAATRAIIDKFTVTNTDASARTITVNIVPNGQSATGSNTITSALSVAAGASVELAELKNHILSAGDAVSVLASVASKVVIRMSGREIV